MKLYGNMEIRQIYKNYTYKELDKLFKNSVVRNFF